MRVCLSKHPEANREESKYERSFIETGREKTWAAGAGLRIPPSFWLLTAGRVAVSGRVLRP